MNSLKKNSNNDLKQICLDLNFNHNLMLKNIIDHLEKQNNVNSYTLEKQIGNKGKDGTTYLVSTSSNIKYAMKTFKKRKSSNKIEKEANLQKIAAKANISPKVIDVNLNEKYIVMERMNKHLVDVMKENNGNLTLEQQKKIVKIFQTLDNIKIFHGDSNILNYMYKGKKLYIIDFGMSKEINEKFIKKIGSKTPNIDVGLLGFILKLKEMKCPSSSYSHLKLFINESNIKNFNI